MLNYPPSNGVMTCAWATRPASPAVGDRIRLTDHRNIICEWNGSLWIPQGAFQRTSMPVGIPSSGTMGNNGAFTLAANFQTTFSLAATGGVWLFFPAGAIHAASSAGVYYCIMSSQTQGVVYQDRYMGGDPTAPVTPAPWATIGPGAYTQVTTEVSLRLTTIPRGMLGPQGAVRIEKLWMSFNSANSKIMRLKFGNTASGYTTFVESSPATSNASMRYSHFFQNMGSHDRQLMPLAAAGMSGAPGQTTGGWFTYGPVNTNHATQDPEIVTSGQLTSASEFLIDMGQNLEVLPG